MQNHRFIPKYKVSYRVSSLSEVIDWGATLLNVPKSWNDTKGKGIIVGVIDTGKPTHSDISSAIVDSYDFTGEGVLDNEGHSTATCGTLGARANNNGIIGIAPECSIITLKALDSNGSGEFDWIISAVYKAIELKVDILNLSLGAPMGDKRLLSALIEASKAGITVVCANGNDGGPVNFPAAYSIQVPGLIAVSAIDKNKNIADFSSHGKETVLSAPGVDMLVPYLNNKYAKLNGTSFSAPFVAGCAALILSKHRIKQGSTPINTPEDLKKHLLYLVSDAGKSGFDDYFGHGIIDFTNWATIEDKLPPTEPVKTPTICDVIKSWFK